MRMDPSSDPTIRLAVQHLVIPPTFNQLDDESTPEEIQSRAQWVQETVSGLATLRDRLASEPEHLSPEDEVWIVVACAPFLGDGSWVSPPAREIATGMS